MPELVTCCDALSNTSRMRTNRVNTFKFVFNVHLLLGCAHVHRSCHGSVPCTFLQYVAGGQKVVLGCPVTWQGSIEWSHIFSTVCNPVTSKMNTQHRLDCASVNDFLMQRRDKKHMPDKSEVVVDKTTRVEHPGEVCELNGGRCAKLLGVG